METSKEHKERSVCEAVVRNKSAGPTFGGARTGSMFK